MEHVIVGSTAERVVRRSKIPVLTVRGQDWYNLTKEAEPKGPPQASEKVQPDFMTERAAEG